MELGEDLKENRIITVKLLLPTKLFNSKIIKARRDLYYFHIKSIIITDESMPVCN